MGRRQHVLAPVLDPLDRAAEPTARLRENDLLAIAARLGAEPAADILADHPNRALGQVEQRGEVFADVVMRLGGEPDGQRPARPVEIGHRASGLQRQRNLPREAGLVGDAPRRPFERAGRVAALVGEPGGDVAGPGIVEGRRTVRHRRLDPGDGLKRAVVDLDQPGRILRPVRIVGDRERHRLAHIAHPAAREEGLGTAPDRRMPVAHGRSPGRRKGDRPP